VTVHRSTLAGIIEAHQESGSVPVKVLEDLLRQDEPFQRDSENGLYVLRLYDGYEHRWFDETKAVSWDEALALWKEKTKNGMERACYDDGQYFDIFPAETRMIVNSFSD
jgi:hypothetical protein